MKGSQIRLPRTFLLIISGVTILGGGSGAAAVYIGADRLLGPSYADINGLTCTTVETIRIRKADRYWIRKYVTTNEPGDGIARLKTALRVARTVQQREHSDLVQVTVLDQSGPTDRAHMRGRAIGAQVVYMPDVDKAPEGMRVQPITAYYVDGAADQTGEFWGLPIDLPQEYAEYLSASLTDDADCLDPVVESGEGHGTSRGHGADTGHGKASGHGEASGDGDAHGGGQDGGHGAGPAAEGHAAPNPHGEPTPVAEGAEKPGLVASLMGMVGLGGAEPAADAHGAASGHEPPADDHLEPGQGAEAEHHDEPVTQAAADPHAAKPGVDHAADAANAESGWRDTVKGMVGLDTSDQEPAAPVETSGQEDGSGEPDSHGAAWLAKMRAQPLTPEGHAGAASSAEPEAHVEASQAPAVAEEDDPEKRRKKPGSDAQTH